VNRFRARGVTGAGSIALSLVAMLGMASCATNSPSGPSAPPASGAVSGSGTEASTSGRVVQVVAAENFWGSIASQVGGVHAHVLSIITNPNTDPHSYEPTATDARTLAASQLVIENGIGYDPWVQKLLSADGTWWSHSTWARCSVYPTARTLTAGTTRWMCSP